MGPCAIDGLWIEEGFIAEPGALFALLAETTAWDRRIRARMTASFGIPYNYSGLAYPEVPFPDPLGPLLDRLERRLGYRPNNCLANYYPDGGSTMGFHADSTASLTPDTGISIVSLGAERPITFRPRSDRQATRDFALRSGSLLHMSAELQRGWEHAILSLPGSGGRISLTFRDLLPS